MRLVITINGMGVILLLTKNKSKQSILFGDPFVSPENPLIRTISASTTFVEETNQNSKRNPKPFFLLLSCQTIPTVILIVWGFPPLKIYGGTCKPSLPHLHRQFILSAGTTLRSSHSAQIYI